MTIDSPIGVFDSGVGGLSVWRELYQLLPNEQFLYFADSQYSPYGSKSKEAIIERCNKIVNYFVARNVKMIVVACNTATAAAIGYLREHYNVPFVGMEPAVKPAAELTQTGIVGVLATEGTFKGRLFHKTSHKYASNVQVETVVGKGFVELVELGNLVSDKANRVVGDVVLPLIDKGIDCLVLACTHYPFLSHIIEQYTKPYQIQIIDPALSVAKQVQNILFATSSFKKELNKNIYEFYSSSSNTKTLEFLVKRIMSERDYNKYANFDSLVLK